MQHGSLAPNEEPDSLEQSYSALAETEDMAAPFITGLSEAAQSIASPARGSPSDALSNASSCAALPRSPASPVPTEPGDASKTRSVSLQRHRAIYRSRAASGLSDSSAHSLRLGRKSPGSTTNDSHTPTSGLDSPVRAQSTWRNRRPDMLDDIDTQGLGIAALRAQAADSERVGLGSPMLNMCATPSSASESEVSIDVLAEYAQTPDSTVFQHTSFDARTLSSPVPHSAALQAGTAEQDDASGKRPMSMQASWGVHLEQDAVPGPSSVGTPVDASEARTLLGGVRASAVTIGDVSAGATSAGAHTGGTPSPNAFFTPERPPKDAHVARPASNVLASENMSPPTTPFLASSPSAAETELGTPAPVKLYEHRVHTPASTSRPASPSEASSQSAYTSDDESDFSRRSAPSEIDLLSRDTSPLPSLHERQSNALPRSESTFTSPLQDLTDTFASAMADLGLDEMPLDDPHAGAPMPALDNVQVLYRAADGPSSLASLLPPTDAALPPSIQQTPPPSRAPRPGPQTPEPPLVQGPRIEVYGQTVWWPLSFDPSANLNWDSVSLQQRAHLFANASQDLLDCDTHLGAWIGAIRKQEYKAPEALMQHLQAEQLARLATSISPATDTELHAAEKPALPLPANIPYPLLAKVHKAQHEGGHAPVSPAIAQPTHAGISLSAARDTVRHDAQTAMRGAAGAAGYGWMRIQEAIPRVPAAPSFLGTLARRSTKKTRDTSSLFTPLAQTPLAQTPRARTQLQAPQEVPLARAPKTSAADAGPTHGLGIPGVGTSMGLPTPELGSPRRVQSLPQPHTDPDFDAALRRMLDAVPEMNESIARMYLSRAKNDDVRATSDYLHDHARRDETQRRGFFSRTPRLR
ncbi:hypothetical protein MVES1_001184 [Malassezia vespertilionis]|uniref:uncharacterized protein n=1 Tax=Malassezia vespertilionis TaxID=2020962 RepID=UPI0024B0D2ED|nr:uncharacterized protein MVES1_001184 [Malassezia vespertilionis]WFD05850.1 hypothetical protein MVES1_001184 [Malassezia vespertilionis]